MRPMIWMLCATLVVACARDDADGDPRDVTETGAAEDVIGRPEGADSIPPEMIDRDPDSPRPSDSLTQRTRDSAARVDSGYKRPERRPIREIPPLTRPDSGKP